MLHMMIAEDSFRMIGTSIYQEKPFTREEREVFHLYEEIWLPDKYKELVEFSLRLIGTSYEVGGCSEVHGVLYHTFKNLAEETRLTQLEKFRTKIEDIMDSSVPSFRRIQEALEHVQ